MELDPDNGTLFQRCSEKFIVPDSRAVCMESYYDLNLARQSGEFAPASVGVHQGGVISPLLMNLSYK